MKTNELTGAALDWAVAKCEGVTVLPKMRGGCYVALDRGETVLLRYSTDWAQAGPIIEREGITVAPDDVEPWCAFIDRGTAEDVIYSGTTPLIAAMRCYVASKLGEEVEIPDELK
jgi:hypothetical protein